MKTGKPILGICRGLQIANVYFGGSLYQDVKYIDTTINHMQKWLPDLPTHDIKIEEGNILFEIFGEKARTNSYHHQMIKDLGNGLTSISKANDGIIEAFQNKNHKFFMLFNGILKWWQSVETKKCKRFLINLLKAVKNRIVLF